MWSPIAVVAILLAAAPSGALRAGSEGKRSLQAIPLGYASKYCISLPQKDSGRPSYCVPGTTFRISCNRCICRRSGLTAICTKKNCYKLLEEDCKPGSVKAVECNICICSPAGKWACTQKQCRSSIQYIDCEGEPRDATETNVTTTPSQMCVPSSSFLRGCDRCYCSKDGMTAVCKSRPCNGVIGKLIQLDSIFLPEVGYPTLAQNVTVQNATHFCFRYGGTSVCTNMAQARGFIGDIIGEISGKRNVEGSTVSLNETHGCLNTPETVVCVDMGTILGVLAQLLSPDVPGTLNPTVPHFENETHICATHGKQVICFEDDRIDALQVTYVPEAPYDSPTLPGKPDFMNETHVCFIYDEAIICIELSVYKGSGKETDPAHKEVKCEPLTSFKRDCNTCWCDESGKLAVCTLMACLKRSTRGSGKETDPAHKEVKCEPLTSFKRDCNTCWCDESGKLAVCTLMACLKRSTRDVSCRPGTTYKEKCNTCTCLQDGTPGGCTRMACPPGSY